MSASGRKLLRRMVPLSLLMLVVSCDSILCGSTELSRVALDGGGVEAIVTERGCGATTSFTYMVHVVPEGARPEERDMVFFADKARNLRVTWQDGARLLITYDAAKIFSFRNFSTVSGHEIEIVERLTDDCPHTPHPPPAIIRH